MNQSYNVIYEGGSGEIVEKKSRFIAHVFPVHSEEEASEYIEQIRKKYWDARHNCHAFVIGPNNETSRCSDDGEPSGTAGRPILEVLQGRGIHDALVIVTRYFGGTLLGTGGLVRAYSQAAQAGLQDSSIMTKQQGRKISIKTDYNGIGKLQYIVGNRQISVADTRYGEAVEMDILVPEEEVASLTKEITEATAGKAELDISDELFFAVLNGKPIVFENI
ncbi:MAG: YigZ family protein [Lachnospiraceae bacterium]|nr:YigZ family protein [Lachnospiraceae bacterium]